MKKSKKTRTITVTNYFGGCPQCGSAKFLNVGRDHWCVCDDHKLKWNFGSNLLSGWRDEDEGVWRKNAEIMDGYTAAEPVPEGVWSADPAIRKMEYKIAKIRRDVESLLETLDEKPESSSGGSIEGVSNDNGDDIPF